MRRPSGRRPRRIGRVGGQFAVSRSVYGRPRRMTVRKLVKIGTGSTVDRFQGITRAYAATATRDATGVITSTTGGGSFYLANAPNAVGNQSFPLHVMDLTTAQTASSVLHELTIGDTGNPVFAALPGQTSTGTASNQWQVEYLDNTLGTGPQARYRQHIWYDMRFLLYGATSQPTFYEIMLVKLLKDELAPIGDDTYVGPENDNRRAFWHSMVQRCAFNPIMPAHYNALRGLKVLKRQRVYLPPSSNDDLDVAPASKMVKWFIRDGRIRDYAYGGNSLNADTGINSSNFVVTSGTRIQDYVHPKSRLYIIIRAMNTTQIDTTTDSNYNTPTYDMVVRRKVRYEVQG